jgi:hypothetical protein
MDYSKYVARRLHPVRLTVSLLHHELDQAKGNKDVSLSREMLESVISTMEIFIEDCDRAMPKGGGSAEGTSDKKFVETAKQTVKV